ncbi:MAG: UDP-N-acetylmuramoyl-L-alanine--D-glutamate ligase [Flavobacteriales bacterium]|jgi:UDP-N-acetylmuramoylalanine--D-glutamate ligase|nr:UDP-N-acetylmuramoyl-L-alanine--D-glutamate ligase [Flavobacteriales bacterium]
MKNLVVLGGGESGIGAAILGLKKGYKVFVSDKGRIKEKYKKVLSNLALEWEEKQHSEDLIFQADVVVKSPGIPDTVLLVEQLIEKGIEVISEIEFAGRFTEAKMICVTGSNGKTTTALLLYHILKNGGLNVGLAGNVGKSLALQVAEDNFDFYVVELSSFQLDGMFHFKADIAILMNITPDHLDRYDYEMQKYIDSKFRIIQNQASTDYFIYCLDDENIAKEVSKRDFKSQLIPFTIEQDLNELQGAYIKNEQLLINYKNQELNMSIYKLALEGKHNIYNSMASGVASSILELRKDVVRDSLTDFQNVEHRMEKVVSVHGIDFVNDSKATNINSAWYALETMPAGVVWIVGGVDKGNDYSILKDVVKEKVTAIVCLGKDNTKIREAFKDSGVSIAETVSMEGAVKFAYQLGKKGDTVLLSPACASFDLFEDYEDRGRQFKEQVRGL